MSRADGGERSSPSGQPAAAVNAALVQQQPQQPQSARSSKNYRGFVGGVFSGIAKLSVGHPFDTIKVRLQTAPRSQFAGPLDCLLSTVRNEGVRGVYKGATPPLLGWMAMDSLMLGSLTLYRRKLHETLFSPATLQSLVAKGIPVSSHTIATSQNSLPTLGHAIAGVGAGWTVSFIAAPVEHVKARLQVQYAADKNQRLYRGPVDCVKKIFRTHGVHGLYRGLSATLLFRTFFFFWWGSYDVISRALKSNTNLSTPSINFWAGGLSAQVFWLTSYPSDCVKQRIMTDPLGGELKDGIRKFPRWRDAAKYMWRTEGPRAFWRGFVPCFLRAFPANAAALVAFEGVMRALPE